MHRFRSIFILLVHLLYCNITSAQNSANEVLLATATGIRTKQATLLNISGKLIIIDKAAGTYSGPFFARMFPGFGLKMGYKAVPDSMSGIPAYHISTPDKKTGKSTEHYFIQKNTDSVLGIEIAATNPPDTAFIRSLLQIAQQDQIKDSILSKISPPVIHFAGRNIAVNETCRWRNASCIQCPKAGEMSWSLHNSLAEAEAQTQLMITGNYPAKEGVVQDRQIKKFSVDKEEDVAVVFEGTAIRVHKIVYKIDGMVGQMALMEGSRTLVVYYVSATVRGKFVSCVLSHWTSDHLSNDLPPLLSEVMMLK